MSMNQIIDNYLIHIILIIVSIILLSWVMYRNIRKHKAQKQFDRLETYYNDLVSTPILFKINKTDNIVKTTPEKAEIVLECKKIFDEILKEQEEIMDVMAEAEDAISYDKYKVAFTVMDDIDMLIASCIEKTRKLEEDLNTILEQETIQREEIINVKEKFRSLKKNYSANHERYFDSYDAIESRFTTLEDLFSEFEEWMFASEYVKAEDISDKIQTNITFLDEYYDRIPKLYEITKVGIPKGLDIVFEKFNLAKSKNVYVEHLEISKTISQISEALKEDILRLNKGEFEAARESLNHSLQTLDNIISEIDNEVESFALVIDMCDRFEEKLLNNKEKLILLQKDQEKIDLRFNIKNFKNDLNRYDSSFRKYTEDLEGYKKRNLEERVPAASLLPELKNFNQNLSFTIEEFEALDALVKQVNSDETRANNQLLKLYLIINDIQVRIRRRNLVSISKDYKEDVQRAYHYAEQINNLLQEDILNVAVLNATLEEAIDYVYKLHNNINNLIGVVDMCENAIVYANKYRAYVPTIDTELTRAELAFNNGEYTQSLAMVIKAIDQYKPNSHYEELIRNNAKSAA